MSVKEDCSYMHMLLYGQRWSYITLPVALMTLAVYHRSIRFHYPIDIIR